MNGTTIKQDNEFIKAVIDNDLLSNAISWINNNMQTDAVFDEDKLKAWAEDNEFVHIDDIHKD